MSSQNDHINRILTTLPSDPGVYQYFDKDGKLIYVGKAKNLRKRVGSYFNRETYDNRKTQLLVKTINDIKYIVVDTELDALLLENSFIKKHQPRFNISLKDDKTYPWICITKEPFPRIFPTRKKIIEKAQYFGPYASVKMMHTLLDFIHKIYQLRSCRLNLTQENIQAGKFKVCLEYHIGNCKGPCEGRQSEKDYDENIESIRQIIKGNIGAVVKHLQEQMKAYSSEYKFELAQQVKEKIDLLERYQSKSTVVSPTIDKVDVFSLLNEEDAAYVNYMKVINGAIINSYTLEIKKKLEENREEMLALAIVELRQQFDSDAKEIIVPFDFGMELSGINIVVPQRGDKRHLLELSEKNALMYKKEKELQADLVDPERRVNQLMEKMKKELRLSEEPRRIECFDNSNFQGAYPVSAMPVFINGKPAKKEYRHFIVKTVEGPDDFATMEEVIYRRYKRVKEEGLEMPQLIVIDGGKGQLGAAVKSLEKLELMGKVGVIGIAKKLEEIYYPGDPYPLHLDKKSETLRVIQHIRDEAHRFGITFHRKQRSKGTIKTELKDIKGVGEATITQLLRRFKSVKRIKEASNEELIAEIGEARTKLLRDYFEGPPTND